MKVIMMMTMCDGDGGGFLYIFSKVISFFFVQIF
jgi:hypothetical protein